MRMRKLWEEMLYFLRQKPFVIFAALTAAGSYGFAITHEGIGVDDTMAGVYLDEGLEPYMGRWTVYLVNKLFRIGEFTPFITELMGCLLLMAGVLLFCVLLRRIFGERVGTAGYTVFACVFLSCPFISEVWVYYYHDGVDMGYILLALSLLALTSGWGKTGKTRLKYLSESTLFLCAAVGCYESFLILYLVGVLVILFFQGLAEKEEMNWRVMHRLLLSVVPVLGCMILRVMVRELMIMVFSLQDMGEIARFRDAAEGLSIFEGENWLACIIMLLKRYWLVYFVNGAIYFPIAVYVTALGGFGAASVIFMFKRKTGWYMLLALGMAFLPMTLIFASLSVPLYRSCQYMPFFAASAMLLLYLFLKRVLKQYGAFVFGLLSACLVWNQAYESNRNFYTDYMKYEYDKEVLTSVAEEVIGEYGRDAKVILRGSTRLPML